MQKSEVNKRTLNLGLDIGLDVGSEVGSDVGSDHLGHLGISSLTSSNPPRHIAVFVYL